MIVDQRLGYEPTEIGYESSKFGYESSEYETTGYRMVSRVKKYCLKRNIKHRILLSLSCHFRRDATCGWAVTFGQKLTLLSGGGGGGGGVTFVTLELVISSLVPEIFKFLFKY